MPYVDLNTIHNPATGTIAPASWGDQVRDDLEFLIDPPACSVFHSTVQSVAHGSWVPLLANSENYDNDGMHSTVSNTARITIATAGRYDVNGTISFAVNTTGNRAISVWLNGTTQYVGMLVPSAASNSTVVSVSRTLVLNAGDYIEARAFQTCGAALDATLNEFNALYITR